MGSGASSSEDDIPQKKRRKGLVKDSHMELMRELAKRHGELKDAENSDEFKPIAIHELAPRSKSEAEEEHKPHLPPAPKWLVEEELKRHASPTSDKKKSTSQSEPLKPSAITLDSKSGEKKTLHFVTKQKVTDAPSLPITQAHPEILLKPSPASPEEKPKQGGIFGGLFGKKDEAKKDGAAGMPGMAEAGGGIFGKPDAGIGIAKKNAPIGLFGKPSGKVLSFGLKAPFKLGAPKPQAGETPGEPEASHGFPPGAESPESPGAKREYSQNIVSGKHEFSFFSSGEKINGAKLPSAPQQVRKDDLDAKPKASSVADAMAFSAKSSQSPPVSNAQKPSQKPIFSSKDSPIQSIAHDEHGEPKIATPLAQKPAIGQLAASINKPSARKIEIIPDAKPPPIPATYSQGQKSSLPAEKKAPTVTLMGPNRLMSPIQLHDAGKQTASEHDGQKPLGFLEGLFRPAQKKEAGSPSFGGKEKLPEQPPSTRGSAIGAKQSGFAQIPSGQKQSASPHMEFKPFSIPSAGDGKPKPIGVAGMPPIFIKPGDDDDDDDSSGGMKWEDAKSAKGDKPKIPFTPIRGDSKPKVFATPNGPRKAAQQKEDEGGKIKQGGGAQKPITNEKAPTSSASSIGAHPQTSATQDSASPAFGSRDITDAASIKPNEGEIPSASKAKASVLSSLLMPKPSGALNDLKPESISKLGSTIKAKSSGNAQSTPEAIKPYQSVAKKDEESKASDVLGKTSKSSFLSFLSRAKEPERLEPPKHVEAELKLPDAQEGGLKENKSSASSKPAFGEAPSITSRGKAATTDAAGKKASVEMSESSSLGNLMPDAPKPTPSAPQYDILSGKDMPPPSEASKSAAGAMKAAGSIAKGLDVGTKLSLKSDKLVLDEEFGSKKLYPKSSLDDLKPASLDVPDARALKPAFKTAQAVSVLEFTTYYSKCLSKPVFTQAQADEYYEKASMEQKKFLYALHAEELYWRYKNEPEGGQNHRKFEQDFVELLEASSPEQRGAIELCINLTKALRALEILTNPKAEQALMREAQSIYGALVMAHPEIRQMSSYLISKKGMEKAFMQGSLEPSPDFLAFVSRLDEGQRDSMYAMRASFFDQLVNDKSTSEALRNWAADRYAKIFMARPQIAPLLEQYVHIRKAVSLFMPMCGSTMPEDEQKKKEEWISLLNGKEETRTIVFYVLAALFLHPSSSAAAPQRDAPQKGRH